MDEVRGSNLGEGARLLFINCLLYSIFIPSVRREKARPHELTRRSGRAKDDAGDSTCLVDVV